MQLQSSTARVFSTPELLMLLFDLLSMQDLRMYGLCSKAAFDEVKGYFDRHFSIENTLGKFLPPASVPRFREVQRRTGTLIGGSVALQFWARVEYPSSHLELYVHELFATALLGPLQAMGCVERDLRNGEDVRQEERRRPRRGVSRIVYLTARFERGIRVVVTSARPVNTILGYHCTALLNFISSDYAYSLYGHETLREGLALYSLSAGSHTRSLAKSKYEARGWMTVEGEDSARALEVFPRNSRSVGDGDTWIMRLDRHSSGDAYLRDATWGLFYTLSGECMIFPQCDFC